MGVCNGAQDDGLGGFRVPKDFIAAGGVGEEFPLCETP